MITKKNTINTLIVIIFIFFGSHHVSPAQSTELVDHYFLQADTAKKSGRYLEAAQLFEKTAEAENNSLSPRLVVLDFVLNETGFCYGTIGQYEKAISFFQKALAVARQLGQENLIAVRINNIGVIYEAWGQYEKALKYFDESMAINRRLGIDLQIAMISNNIGNIYKVFGQYHKSIKCFEESLSIALKLKTEDHIAMYLMNLGEIYAMLGQDDKALTKYEEALSIAKRLGQQDYIAMCLNSMGGIYTSQVHFDKALKYYEEALTIDRKLGRENQIATTLSDIGNIYALQEEHNKSIRYIEDALAINRKLKRETHIAKNLSSLACIYVKLNKYDKALMNFEEALNIYEISGNEPGVASEFYGIGIVYYDNKQFEKAIEYFNKSITLIEKLRKNVTGTTRRDYLASQMSAYCYLVSAYILNQDAVNAFYAIENSRAKLLAERLAGSDTNYPVPNIKSIQQQIPKDTAIISFANANWDTPAVLVITQNEIAAIELDGNKFLNSLPTDYRKAISNLYSKQRRWIVQSKSLDSTVKIKDKSAICLEDVISYYRRMLTDVSSEINKNSRGIKIVRRTTDIDQRTELDGMLYDFLLKPFKKQLAGKKRMIIIPDGVLAYLPFETLREENSRYLVEEYDISYVQSMSVMGMLGKRIWATGRKSLLAFGGAVYDDVSFTADMVTNEKQLLTLAKNVHVTNKSRGALSGAYASLGIGKWNNLPGTLNEVKEIAKIVKGSTVITGRDVSEGKVKQMSSSGELAQYKVIHFATHGIVVPEIPELSAIVLTQVKNQPSGEDGYLRMDKIEELKLNAEFVNLSACETGLGKIFGGEGVVGLTQSFLLAGANGLSVSLWNVNDVSTSRFMAALYKLVEQKKIGYCDAITEIKRGFILGEFGQAYKSPYYWAPFVYYGKL